MRHDTDASYRRQPHAGFAALRFEAPIEAEFRSVYRARSRKLVRIGALLAVILLAVSALLDRSLPAGSASGAIYLVLALSLPLLCLVAASYSTPLRRYERALILCSAGALCVGALSLPIVAGVSGLASLLAGTVVTGFVYLMLGLRLMPALCFAVPTGVALICFELAASDDLVATAYAATVLLFANLMGALTCYRLEVGARSIFLERQIVSILGGSDIATGIPNRRAFNTHLQSVRRQSRRDSKPLAVALIELVDFARCRAHLGRQESDRVMRRIAHTVASSARRPLDFAARFSDAELALVLYDPDEQHLNDLLKQVREQVALLDIVVDGRRGLSVIIGAAWCPAGVAYECDALLESANSALGEARELEGLGIAILPVGASASARESQIMRGPWPSADER
jgi:diguanylate cyclase (GGDEF)-like protein